MKQFFQVSYLAKLKEKKITKLSLHRELDSILLLPWQNGEPVGKM